MIRCFLNYLHAFKLASEKYIAKWIIAIVKYAASLNGS